MIEDNVVVAAGAVARGHLNGGWYYGGVPAKPIKPIAAQSWRGASPLDAPSGELETHGKSNRGNWTDAG